ncbi:MAG: hypothetical protein M3450_14750 [Actinomycetota bacterium]|nr:hypothetical protein [Actinomycetota bacterium]
MITRIIKAQPELAEVVVVRTGPGSRAQVDLEDELRPTVDSFEGEERR